MATATSEVGVKVIVEVDVAPTIPRLVNVATPATAATAVVPINEPPPAVIDAVTVAVLVDRTPEPLVIRTTG